MRQGRWQKQPTVQYAIAIGLSPGIWLYTETVATPSANAQISGDNSLGTLVNGSLTDSCTAAVCTITGGTTNATGSTLLHSFEQFTSSQSASDQSAPGSSALFVDPGVSDIIVRVTGGAQSFLNGTIGTNPNSSANLFFINPSGITFGTNAQLDIGGSFLASTASEIVFTEGISLATGEATPPTSELLTVSTPVGLGFLPNASSGSIQVQGTGNRLTFGAPDTPNSQFVNRIFQQPLPPSAPFPPLPPISELAVRPGQKLSLFANGVQLDGGNLTSLGGQIEIGSIASGTVQFNTGSPTDYSQVSQFADILLANRSTLEVSAPASGTLQLRGQDINVLDSSALLAETLPSNPLSPSIVSNSLAKIDIAATGDVTVSGATTDPAIPFNPPFFSYLSVDVAPGATNDGGQLNLRARTLTVSEGGQISAATYGSGAGGQLNIETEEAVVLTGGSSFGPSGLFSVADTIGSGNGGDIALETGKLQLFGGARIFTDSFTPGTSGDININASQIELTETSPPVKIPTPDGVVQTVSATTIRSDMSGTSNGKGGTIRLNTEKLLVTEGAEIVTGTSSTGESGDIEIEADEVVVSGQAPLEGPSTILTIVAPTATGNGGALTIATNRLQILNSAQVGTSTAGLGRAGDIQIENAESVLISGQNSLGRSGLFANAVNRTGSGGNLLVEAETLKIEKGGTLNVSNFSSGTNAQRPPGQGDAGNLEVNARQISLSEEGIISADTAAGDRGNITIQTQALTLRKNSRITANATGVATGGNININAPDGFIVAVPDENSDITANAVFGDGGRINITAQSILGIEPRPALTPKSDITTSSEFGRSGETRLETLDTELRAENTPLPQSTDIPLVAQGCNATGSTNSRFVQSARGGISNSPYGTLNSRESLADISLPSSLSTTYSSSPTTNLENSPNTITEAQGWNINPQGDVVLLAANASENNRCISWQ